MINDNDEYTMASVKDVKIIDEKLEKVKSELDSVSKLVQTLNIFINELHSNLEDINEAVQLVTVGKNKKILLRKDVYIEGNLNLSGNFIKKDGTK